jgi:putative transposase
MPTREPYSSSLTDSEWQQIEPLLPLQKLFGRPPRYHKRDILDALFYVVRTGCAWRLLPHDLPPWRIVYYYFMTWRREGLWQRIHDSLRDRVRLRSGKKKAPTAAIIDSQSVKTSNHGGVRGYDAGKKVMGRKRHLLVDTLGLILYVVVHPASIQDREGAKLVLSVLLKRFGWLRCIFADSGYAGELVTWCKRLLPRRGVRLEIVKRSDADQHRFVILRKRWIVERTFGWLSKSRRLSKDYEYRTDNSEAMILIAATHLMLARLA